MVELDNLDVKILAHLQGDSRKSFQEIAKNCLTSVPTVKSRVDRLLDMGVIRKFTLDIDSSKLGVSEALVLISAKPLAVNRISQELLDLEEVRELYITTDSEAAIAARIAGDLEYIISIQDRIDLADINNIRVLSVKSLFRKDSTIPLSSSSITLTCAYCDKKVTGDAIRKKFDDKDYFFCCNTCQGEFEKKYAKLISKV